jgi:hypothetical protein
MNGWDAGSSARRPAAYSLYTRQEHVSEATSVRTLSMRLAMKAAAIGVAMSLFAGAATAAVIKIDEDTEFKVGLHLQTRISFLDEDVVGGDRDEARVDANIRRVYFYFGGEISPKFQYFAILAGDKMGQAGVDAAKVGAGTGLAIRDAWVTLALIPELKVQLGRMYVPFFRGFGSQAAFAVQPLDLSDIQLGGISPNRRAARDDGVTVWGNIDGGTLQYRLALMDSVDAPAKPADGTAKPTQRLAGRVVLNLISKEPGWFTKGAHLDGDGIVSVGVGFETIHEFDGANDHTGVGGDVYVSYPVGEALQVIAEAGGTVIDQNDVKCTGTYTYANVGVVLKDLDTPVGFLHPYVRFEKSDLDEAVAVAPGGSEEEMSVGVHCYPNGLSHSYKITLDLRQITPHGGESFNRGTMQFQVSF